MSCAATASRAREERARLRARWMAGAATTGLVKVVEHIAERVALPTAWAWALRCPPIEIPACPTCPTCPACPACPGAPAGWSSSVLVISTLVVLVVGAAAGPAALLYWNRPRATGFSGFAGDGGALGLRAQQRGRRAAMASAEGAWEAGVVG